MFKLFYPDENGVDVFVADFDSQKKCIDQAIADQKESYTIQHIVDSQVVMVISC
jgi:hypothetical protein